MQIASRRFNFDKTESIFIYVRARRHHLVCRSRRWSGVRVSERVSYTDELADVQSGRMQAHRVAPTKDDRSTNACISSRIEFSGDFRRPERCRHSELYAAFPIVTLTPFVVSQYSARLLATNSRQHFDEVDRRHTVHHERVELDCCRIISVQRTSAVHGKVLGGGSGVRNGLL